MLTKKLTLVMSVILFAAMLNFVGTNNASAAAVDDSCQPVEVIYARGSGQETSTSREYQRFRDDLKRYLGDSPLHIYELGSESYGGNKYPAVNVSDLSNGNLIGAWTSGGASNDYGRSVDSGVRELSSYVNQRYDKCPSAFFVLGGYSQGAQVIGQSLEIIDPMIRDQIVYVGLFGDPKLYFPEGVGWNPPACRGQGISIYRRVVSNCDLDNGSLGARIPYLPSDMMSKTGLWCYDNDLVCGSSFTSTSGHGIYGNPGMAIDVAVKEAAQRLQGLLVDEATDRIQQTIDTTSLMQGQDTMIIVDPRMLGEIQLTNMKQYAADLAGRINEQGGRVALAEMYRTDTSTSPNATAKLILSGFMNGQLGFYQALDSIGVLSDDQAASMRQMILGVGDIIKNTDWTDGGKRTVLYLNDELGDRGYDEYDSGDELLADVATVREQAYVNGGVQFDAWAALYTTNGEVLDDIVQATGGAFYNNADILPAFATPKAQLADDEVDFPLEQIMSDFQSNPVLRLPLTAYSADPGQEITFDLSGSDLRGNEITRYNWDFDGDGTVDLTTTSPKVNHTYTTKFDGYMKVQATTDKGVVVTTTAQVQVGVRVKPVLPEAPTDLKVKILSTKNSISTVQLSWRSPALLPDHYVLKLNGIGLGILLTDRTSVEIRDIDRSMDNEVSLVGATAEGAEGNVVTITIAKASNTPGSGQTGGQHGHKQNSFLQWIFEQIRLLLQRIFASH